MTVRELVEIIESLRLEDPRVMDMKVLTAYWDSDRERRELQYTDNAVIHPNGELTPFLVIE